MNILVMNSGSSSVKFSIFAENEFDQLNEPQLLVDGELSDIGESSVRLRLQDAKGRALRPVHSPLRAPDPIAATQIVYRVVAQSGMPPIDAVGYRVVHPGPNLHGHQLITSEVLEQIEKASDFAPLHNPITVRMIREGQARFPNIAHYACFDTEFHSTLKEEAYTYPLPEDLRRQGLRRYGFHGLSCESAVRSLRNAPQAQGRMVIAHLGSGCSVTAVVDGKSIDTTMGLTPTGGVIMGTRSGDLDPGVLFYLLRQAKRDQATVDFVESLVNHESGIATLSGLPNDMPRIREAALASDPQAVLAIKVFTRGIAKAIGGFCWLMNGLDALVFTGGIGEHDQQTRREILANASSTGIELDTAKNHQSAREIRTISTTDSKTAVFVVPAQEDLMIAVHVARLSRAAL